MTTSQQEIKNLWCVKALGATSAPETRAIHPRELSALSRANNLPEGWLLTLLNPAYDQQCASKGVR